MFRADITIYSEFDPVSVELSQLAREAEEGSAICTTFRGEPVEYRDMPEQAREFFWREGEDEASPAPSQPEDLEPGDAAVFDLTDGDQAQGSVIVNDPDRRFLVIEVVAWGGAVADPDFRTLSIDYERIEEVRPQ